MANKKKYITTADIQLYLVIPYLILSLLSIKIESFRYIIFMSVGIFICGFILKFPKRKLTIRYCFLGVFLLMYFIFGAIGSDAITSLKNLLFVIINFSPIFIYDFFYSFKNDKIVFNISKKILKISIPVIFYTVIATLYYLIRNPYVARNLANWDPSVVSSSNLPIAIGGGYVLVYGIMLIPSVLTFLLLKSREKKKIKLLYFCLIIFLLYFIVKAGFATAFIISVIGVCLILILNGKNVEKYKIIMVLTCIISIILLSNRNFVEYGVNVLSNILADDSIISMRLSEIIPVIFEGDRTSSFGMRVNGVGMSIKAFLNSPVLGLGLKTGYIYANEANFLGMHTQWIDDLAKYGLLLGIPYFSFLYLSFSKLYNNFKREEVCDIFRVLFILVFIVGMFNPIISTSILIYIFIIIPSIIKIKMCKKKYK